MTTEDGLGADELIRHFRRVRAKIEAMDAAHVEALKPYRDALELLKGEIKELLLAAGADSVKTEHGTAYKSIKTSVKLDDRSAFIVHVLRQTPQIDDAMLDHIRGLLMIATDLKPNKTYVEDFIHETNDLPSGVQVSRYIDINIRK